MHSPLWHGKRGIQTQDLWIEYPSFRAHCRMPFVHGYFLIDAKVWQPRKIPKKLHSKRKHKQNVATLLYAPFRTPGK